MNRYEKTFTCFGSIFLWLVHASAGIATEKSACEAVELVEGNPEYNRLVCEGVERLQRKRYAEAAMAFETAMGERLFEYPNVELYPRLALTYFNAGNRSKAKETLAKAELSLSILIGVIHCEETETETETGFSVANRDGSDVRSPYQTEISKRMCGAAYESLYSQRSFEATLHDAKLIGIYYQAKNKIESERDRPK